MPIDTDIAAAADIIALEKIKAQDWRDDAKRRLALEEKKQADWKSAELSRLALDAQKQADWKASDDARRAAEEAQRQIINAGDERRTRALEDETQTRKVVSADFVLQDINELIIALAPNYMKPSTATTPEGRATDTERDGEFLRAAVLKVLAVRADIVAQHFAQAQVGV